MGDELELAAVDYRDLRPSDLLLSLPIGIILINNCIMENVVGTFVII